MVKIERRKPRPGAVETPVRDSRGYQLASPNLPTSRRNVAAHATFVETLEEAAALVERDYALRMGAPGKRASLISAKSLWIVR